MGDHGGLSETGDEGSSVADVVQVHKRLSRATSLQTLQRVWRLVDANHGARQDQICAGAEWKVPGCEKKTIHPPKE